MGDRASFPELGTDLLVYLFPWRPPEKTRAEIVGWLGEGTEGLEPGQIAKRGGTLSFFPGTAENGQGGEHKSQLSASPSSAALCPYPALSPGQSRPRAGDSKLPKRSSQGA